MTEAQMTELFTVMTLAWPNAEMLKGGIQKLGPTILLWANRTRDIDFWIGQQAMAHLCDTCKFPPSIAEFREQAQKITERIRAKVNAVFDEIKLYDTTGEGVEGWYRQLPANSIERATVNAMGGPAKLVTDDGLRWNYRLYEQTFNRLIRSRDAKPLPDFSGRQLPQGRSRT